MAQIGSLTSKNWDVKYLLCEIDIFAKYDWVRPLEDKRSKTVLHGFVETINESKRKPNKWWIDQGRKLNNSLMQK